MSPPASPESAESTSQPTSGLLEVDAYSQYLLRSKGEIKFVLRALLDGGSNITVHFNEGKDFLLTTLVAVDDDGITLDYGSSGEMNRKVQTAAKVFCVTTLDKVKIQFVLAGLKSIVVDGRPAFRAAFPESLLRLQRREYYRLTTPIARPMKCQLPMPQADGDTAAVELNLIDISGGGLAMMVPPEGLALEPGAEFANCRIELPEVGIVVARLQVRNIFEVTLRNGSRVTRVGCQFINLPGPMLTLVQRYIIKIERERKARETGLA